MLHAIRYTLSSSLHILTVFGAFRVGFTRFRAVGEPTSKPKPPPKRNSKPSPSSTEACPYGRRYTVQLYSASFAHSFADPFSHHLSRSLFFLPSFSKITRTTNTPNP